MPKVLLFDLDQTLLDRNRSLIKFLNWQVNFFQLVDANKKSAFIQRFIELDNNGSVWKDTVYAQVKEEFKIEPYGVDELLNSYVLDFNKFSTAFENVEDVIRKLFQQGYQLGLISNGKTPFQQHNFYALGLTEYFSIVVVSEEVELRKPDPLIFEYVCRQLQCKPSDCIFIGDNPVADIQGAKNVGMKTIFFHPTLSLGSQHVDQSIHHYDELESAILKIVHGSDSGKI
ncbi:HAD-IIIA family hydrolase [Acinetobacter sp. WCHAc060033]|uniref:HAD family hydrolase n=1 Tax=Acinetobacter sp. WCHAc060033 TaxID=2518624 RepID=UPI001022CA90|nr:HAD-IA family hydrolase [Acinetobacter sp. WCHAc060033]RZG86629.1 HAD-IIIA family hydrolase [Acinetobacter sp. WCHAc060033]